jgi:hypothetical protein
MALVGLIGGPLAFIGGVRAFFGVFDQPSREIFAFTMLEIGWEAFISIYWTFMGSGRRHSSLSPTAKPAPRSCSATPATAVAFGALLR